MPIARNYKIDERGDFELVFGSSPDCDYAFEDFREKISSRHASLKRVGDRLFLQDLGSSQGTFVNGIKIRKKWHEITLQDDVRLGTIPIEIKPTLLLGQERVGIEAHGLFYTIPENYARSDTKKKTNLMQRAIRVSKSIFKPSRKVICNHLSINAEPGTLTGIMGPSGAGKTVLLDLLSGYLSPEQGRVMVGAFDVHKSFGLIKDIIGYVPQDDTLIPELTVLQSLHYCLQLRYPDMQVKVRQTLIEDVLQRMGFTGVRLDELLNTKIGSPDKRGLSGGERKRVNIAHELVRNPLLLFLDEPTSGLSSVDSEHVIGLLRDICNTNKVTMIMAIHQPSKLIFDQLDQLLLLNHGGNIVYFGPAKEVVRYFHRLTGKECGDRNPADYVLQVLDNGKLDNPPEKFCLDDQREKTDATLTDRKDQNDKKPIQGKKKKHHMIYQSFLLLRRNVRVKISDKASLVLLLSQAPIIALLIVVTFRGFLFDYNETNRFARTWHYFGVKFDEHINDRQTVIFEHLLEKGKDWANKNPGFIGEQTAQGRASILFLFIASAIWFGVINACPEIVSEKTILRREIKGGVCISSYLMAKFCALAVIAFIQTGILLSITWYFLIPTTGKFFVFWFVLFLTTMAASSLGLLISAAVKTEQAALTAVPILIIPQLLLGGLMRPVKYLSGSLFGHLHLSDFVLQKWSFHALLMCDSKNESNVLVQIINLDQTDHLKYVRFIPGKIVDLFFSQPSGGVFVSLFGDTQSLLMVMLHALIPLLLAYVWMKKVYS